MIGAEYRHYEVPHRQPPLSERLRVRALGLDLKAFQVAAEPERKGDDEDRREDADGDVEWPLDAFQGVGQVVEPERVGRRPRDAARRVEGKEPRVAHAARAGEEGGVRAQDRDEATEEDDGAAVAVEEQPPDLELRFVDPDLGAVAPQQPIAAEETDPEADVVSDDRAPGRRRPHQLDRQVVSRTRIQRGDDDHRLARKRNAQAFDGDEGEDRRVAVLAEQGVERVGGEDRRQHPATDARATRQAVRPPGQSVPRRWKLFPGGATHCGTSPRDGAFAAGDQSAAPRRAVGWVDDVVVRPRCLALPRNGLTEALIATSARDQGISMWPEAAVEPAS